MKRYPPSFDENPLTYGFALFSLTLICAFALAMIFQFVFEARARRAVRKVNLLPPPPPVPFASPLTIHRLIASCFLITILFGAFPDVLFLLAWGEASDRTVDFLLLIDRLGDGLTFAPFTMAVALSAWGRQVLNQQLIRDTHVQILPPSWRTIKDQAKILGMVLFIAAGVTIAKAKVGV